MFYFFGNIPGQLLVKSENGYDVNVLIGENGSGKSSLLSEISNFYIKQTDKNVIAIANTVYDKFRNRGSKFNILRVSQGKSLVRNIILESFELLASENLKKLRNVGLTLEYAGFNASISIRIADLKFYYKDIIIESDLSNKEKDNIITFLDSFTNEALNTSSIFTVNFFHDNLNDVKKSYYLSIFLYEKVLKKLKIIKGIEIFFSKNNELIPIDSASSGELTVVTTLIYITVNIVDNSIILIDEPENSLHPKWQIEYIKNLLDLFYLYQPKIIIATHSPLIINGKEIDISQINIFKGTNSGFILHNDNTKNVEEIYEEFFNVTTPENRYLSEKVIEYLNQLSKKNISINTFKNEINELKDNSYDDKQKKVLDNIILMGEDIIKEIDNG